MPGDDRVKQTCAYLRMLLLRPGEYRSVWERQAAQAEPEEIDYAAVARVLAKVDSSPSPGEADNGPDNGRLAETARLALEGSNLTYDTLDSFIEAFSLGPRHAKRLQDLMRGSEAVRVITDDVPPPSTRPSRWSGPWWTVWTRCRTASTPTSSWWRWCAAAGSVTASTRCPTRSTRSTSS